MNYQPHQDPWARMQEKKQEMLEVHTDMTILLERAGHVVGRRLEVDVNEYREKANLVIVLLTQLWT